MQVWRRGSAGVEEEVVQVWRRGSAGVEER